MLDKIDLHIHTHMSDGTCTPKEIIELAVKNNVKVVAITDHDTLDGLKEAEIEANKYGITFLKGIELTCSYVDGRLLHILGIGIDPQNETFLNAYRGMKERKQHNLYKILELLKDQGIHITVEELREHAVTEYLDRVDVVSYLLRKNIVETSVEGWNKYLDPIPYADGELIGIEEALQMIREAGGVSVLAHYTKMIGLQGYSKDEVREHIRFLKSKGLQALERYYPSFTEEECDFAEDLIREYELLPSGGTDFHGKHRPGLDVGVGHKGFYVPYSVYENGFK